MANLEDYENREPAWVKHWLLERYLEVLIFKVASTWSRFVYIDAFAGPWRSETEDLSDTSFGRAINVMRASQAKLAERGISLPMRAVFFEADKKRANRLIQYAHENSNDALQIKAHHDDFISQVNSVAANLTETDFAFALIDPTGYKDIAAARFTPLLKRRGVELLINLMWDFINRFWALPSQASRFDTIFGSDRLNQVDPANLEKSVSKLYTERLKAEAGSSGGRLWAATFPVQNPSKSRTHYFLVYATHAAIGLDTFGNIAESTWQQQAQAKARRKVRGKVRSTANPDLFGDDVSGVKAERQVNASVIREAWLSRLPVSGGELIASYEFEAELLEECGCLPCDVQAVARDLIQEGILEVCAVSAATFQRRTKNFVQFSKSERIRRIR